MEALVLQRSYDTTSQPMDFVRQSMPFVYMYMTLTSADGNPHMVQVYFGISWGNVFLVRDTTSFDV